MNRYRSCAISSAWPGAELRFCPLASTVINMGQVDITSLSLSLLCGSLAVLRICITLMRIQILLFTLTLARILPNTLMRIRIQRPKMMRIRIHNTGLQWRPLKEREACFWMKADRAVRVVIHRKGKEWGDPRSDRGPKVLRFYTQTQNDRRSHPKARPRLFLLLVEYKKLEKQHNQWESRSILFNFSMKNSKLN